MFYESSRTCSFLWPGSSPLIKPRQSIPPSLLFQGSQCTVVVGILTILSAIQPVSSYSSRTAFPSKSWLSTSPAGNSREKCPAAGLKLAIMTTCGVQFCFLMIGTISTPSMGKPRYFVVGRQATSQFQITLSPIEQSQQARPIHFYWWATDYLTT